MRLYAQQAAIEHFTHALEAQHHLADAPVAHLHLARGQAYETLGDFGHARADYECALDAARTMRAGRIEWESMVALGFLWTGHDYAQAGVWLREACVVAETLGDPSLRARSLNRLGNWLQNTGHMQEALAVHQDALRLFETQGDAPGMAHTLGELGMACFFSGRSCQVSA